MMNGTLLFILATYRINYVKKANYTNIIKETEKIIEKTVLNLSYWFLVFF